MNDSQQIYNENTCASIFLKWLGARGGSDWTFRRAEEEFPELANRSRWDFVAHRAGSNDEWIALEVKSLVFPEGESQHGNWHKLVDDVNKRLGGSLLGRYWLADFPIYTFSQAQRKLLVDALERAVQEAAQTLEMGGQTDIGPSIAVYFTHWPKDTRKQPSGIDPRTLHLIYLPHSLLLLKGSGQGSSLGIIMNRIVGYSPEPTIKTAIIGLLKGKANANAQLGLARDKGAPRAVLLLDEHVDFDPQLVAKFIGGLGTSHLSNIDEVYLVSTFGGEHVQLVWPRAADR
jgi:hypothetical protein